MEQKTKKRKHLSKTNNENNEAIKDVDVDGLDRKELLRFLWDNAETKETKDRVYHEELAFQDACENGVVEMVCGRKINVDVFAEGKTIDGSGYDALYGKGVFRKIVTRMHEISYSNPFLPANQNDSGICLKLQRKNMAILEIPIDFFHTENLEMAKKSQRRKEKNGIALPPKVASLNSMEKIVNLLGQTKINETFFVKDPLYADTLTEPSIFGILAQSFIDRFIIDDPKKRKSFSQELNRDLSTQLRKTFPALFTKEYFSNHPFPYSSKTREIGKPRVVISVVSLPFVLLTKTFTSRLHNVEETILNICMELVIAIKNSIGYRTTSNAQYVENMDNICTQLIINAKQAFEWVIFKQNADKIQMPTYVDSEESINIEESSRQMPIKSELGKLHQKIDNSIVLATNRNQAYQRKFEKQEKTINELLNHVLELQRKMSLFKKHTGSDDGASFSSESPEFSSEEEQRPKRIKKSQNTQEDGHTSESLSSSSSRSSSSPDDDDDD